MNQCGKMKLLLSSLLFASLCALSSWSASSDKLVVKQTPDVSVKEGEMVKITCCWTESTGRVHVFWLKSQTGNKEDLNMNNQSQVFQKKEENNCSSLTFPNISREDAGTYICRVTIEIPVLATANGSGTVITVRSKNETSDKTIGGTSDSSSNNQQLPMIISLAVVAPLLLIAVVCFCTLRKKEAQAARVIYEVPHVDSEVAEMDKHSTSSSRGSSQWCQVPVYESFDYFERVETKGGK